MPVTRSTYPLRSHSWATVFRHHQHVIFDVRLVVVDHTPAVYRLDLDLLVTHVVLPNHGQLVGNPLTRLIACGLGTARQSLVSTMNW